jgi:hypothetical protein
MYISRPLFAPTPITLQIPMEWTVNASDALNKVAEKLYDPRGRKIADLISGGVLPARYIPEFDYVINADRGQGLAVQTEDNANGSTLRTTIAYGREVGEMSGYRLNCKTCNKKTSHHSPGIFLNEKGEKRTLL